MSISNQKNFETKQTDQMPLSLLFLTNFVSDSFDDKLDNDNEDEVFKSQKPITKKTFKNGRKFSFKKNFVQNEHLISASKRLNLRPSNVSYFLETLIKVGARDPAAYNLSYSYVDKSLRNVSQKVSKKIKLPWVPPSKFLVH